MKKLHYSSIFLPSDKYQKMLVRMNTANILQKSIIQKKINNFSMKIEFFSTKRTFYLF